MAKKTKAGESNVSVSIQDVAREAGVAASTVSRALTIPGRIAEKTRVKVIEAANRLGYTANAAARNLRVGSSKTVLIVLPGPFNAGASQMIGQMLTVVDSELVPLGYSLLIANIDRRQQADRYILQLAFSGVTSGAILFSSGVPEVDGRSLADSGVPIVSGLFDLSEQGIPSIVTNDRQASRETIEHLMELGHRDFLYVGGPRENYHEIERHRGVLEALEGRPDCTVTYAPGDFHFASGVAAAEAYLAGDRKATAVHCASDDMALAFIRRLVDGGLESPGDVSVVGFDGGIVTSYTVPSLSTVQQPTDLMGRKVVQTIIDLMEKRGEVLPRTVIPSNLTIRESVAAPRGAR